MILQVLSTYFDLTADSIRTIPTRRQHRLTGVARRSKPSNSGLPSYDKTLGTTAALAAGVEFERWSLEQVVEMTADYWRQEEDAKFEDAFAKIG